MSFPERRTALTDAAFATFGEDATWNGVAVRVRLRTRDVDQEYGSIAVVQRVTLFQVRRSEVAAPVVGDVVVTTGGNWTVSDRPMLNAKGVWECPAERSA